MAEPFGKTKDGTPIEVYTLQNANGIVAKVMTRGATLIQLHAPDKDGNMADVVNGFDDVSGYESEANQYFGCTHGPRLQSDRKRTVHLRRQDVRTGQE